MKTIQIKSEDIRKYGKLIGKELILQEGVYIKYPPALNESYITDGAKRNNPL